MPIINTIEMMATYFVPRVTLRCSSQLRKTGPSRRCCSIHWCTRGDALAKQAAATRMKGVVGSPGRNIPITPSMSATLPPIPYSTLARCEGWRFFTDVLGSICMKKEKVVLNCRPIDDRAKQEYICLQAWTGAKIPEYRAAYFRIALQENYSQIRMVIIYN